MHTPDPEFRSWHFGPASLPGRIRENAASLWRVRWAPLPAAGAPIHLLHVRRPRAAAQLGSTCAHLALSAALVYLALGPAQPAKRPGNDPAVDRLPRLPLRIGAGDLGRSGSSGGRTPLPPSAGQLPPEARIALLPPHLPDLARHPLPVPTAVEEAEAPDLIVNVTAPGLPWMSERNGSEGLGKNGLGVGHDHGVGEGPGDRVGVGVSGEGGPYSGLASQVVCRVCPDPQYSEEARKERLQGTVTLRVLVGADGRAKEVAILRGVGLGLDENAARAVGAWQFLPARDRTGRPVAASITVEALFRLY